MVPFITIASLIPAGPSEREYAHVHNGFMILLYSVSRKEVGILDVMISLTEYRWNVLGYSLGVIVEACIHHQSGSSHADPIHISAHFLRATNIGVGKVQVKLLKSGKTFTNILAELVQQVGGAFMWLCAASPSSPHLTFLKPQGDHEDNGSSSLWRSFSVATWPRSKGLGTAIALCTSCAAVFPPEHSFLRWAQTSVDAKDGDSDGCRRRLAEPQRSEQRSENDDRIGWRWGRRVGRLV